MTAISLSESRVWGDLFFHPSCNYVPDTVACTDGTKMESKIRSMSLSC